VLEDILEQEETVVVPLLDIVGREISEESDVDVVCHACLLLGGIGATSAIPALIELFYRYDSELLKDVARALVTLGTGAVEPALATVRDGSLPWYPRAIAANAAVEAARPDPVLQEHVTTALRDLLAGYVARAEDLEDDEISTATSLVVDLAQLADSETRDLIDVAFEADIIDQKLLYFFDYGDSHEFDVQVVRIDSSAPPGKYPRIVARQGQPPPQYPDYDEETGEMSWNPYRREDG
jgi:hypothetical protein